MSHGLEWPSVRRWVKQLSSAIVFLSPTASLAQPELTTELPLKIDAQPVTEIVLEGAELNGVTGLRLEGPGGRQAALKPVASGPSEATFRGNLATASTGLYDLVLLGHEAEPTIFPNAIEVYRTPRVLVTTGEEEMGIQYPFASGVRYTNIEMLVPSSYIGRRGDLAGVRFFPGEDFEMPQGTVILRAKESQALEFESDSLEATGWSVMWNDALPSLEPDGTIIIFALVTFPYDGDSSLVLSLVSDIPAVVSGPRFLRFDSFHNRLRTGRAVITPVPPEDWSGNTPAARELLSSAPVVELVFTDMDVTAEFQVDRREVAVGAPVQFTNLSSNNTKEWRWDFDRDGVVDSTDRHPVHVYTQPGVYSVELVAASGAAEHSSTRIDWIRVVEQQGPGDVMLLLGDNP